jgi:hypothetical protein
MADERKYYVLCRDNCKFEGLTKEQIYAAIAEATGNTPTGVDDAFITKLVEQNKNAATRLWVGTETEYNALVARGDVETDTIYCIKDGDVTRLKTPKRGVDYMTENDTNEILSKVYPVGSIYMSVNEVDPSVLFGGAWERIKDRFLLSAGDNYAAGTEDGSATHTHGAGSLTAAISINTNPTGLLENAFMTMAEVQQGGVGEVTRTTQVKAASGVTVTRTASASASKYGTKVAGNTDTASNMPPYLSVYMWKRIA